MMLDDFVDESAVVFKVVLGLPETSPGSIGPPWHIPRSAAMVEKSEKEMWIFSTKIHHLQIIFLQCEAPKR